MKFNKKLLDMIPRNVNANGFCQEIQSDFDWIDLKSLKNTMDLVDRFFVRPKSKIGSFDIDKIKIQMIDVLGSEINSGTVVCAFAMMGFEFVELEYSGKKWMQVSIRQSDLNNLFLHAEREVIKQIGTGVSTTLHSRGFTKEESITNDSWVNIDLYSKVFDYVRDNFTSISTANKAMTAYGIKHLVEKAIGEYVSEGYVILALIKLGYIHNRDFLYPRCYFNISSKSYNDCVKKVNKIGKYKSA